MSLRMLPTFFNDKLLTDAGDTVVWCAGDGRDSVDARAGIARVVLSGLNVADLELRASAAQTLFAPKVTARRIGTKVLLRDSSYVGSVLLDRAA